MNIVKNAIIFGACGYTFRMFRSRSYSKLVGSKWSYRSKKLSHTNSTGTADVYASGLDQKTFFCLKLQNHQWHIQVNQNCHPFMFCVEKMP